MFRQVQLRPLISARWRYWFIRHRRWILTIMGIAVLILWATEGSTPKYKHNPRLVTVVQKNTVLPTHRIFHAPPGIAEIERRNRSAMFKKFLGYKVKASTRITGGKLINCMLPKLDLSYDSNSFAFYSLPSLKCSGKRMFLIQNGKFVLDKSVVPDPRRLESCLFYHVKNFDDDFYFYSKPDIKVEWPFNPVTVNHDFVRIQCTLKSREDKSADAKFGQGWFWNIFQGKQEGDDHYDELNSKNIEMKGGALPWDEEEVLRQKRDSKEIQNVLDDLDHWKSEDFADDYDKNYPNLDSPTSEFDQFSVHVSPKPEVFQRISNIVASLDHQPKKPNVLMLGLKSVSHLAFQRLMAKTYKFLRTELGAVALENYNVVGELTKDELIPLLTGTREYDLPDVQSWKYNAELMNAYPFIWKKFRQQGYATLFAEDAPMNSIFNTGFYGFGDSPTDHYMRPFWQAVWGSEIHRNSPSFCTGDSANHRYTLRYVEDFFEKYRNVSRFAFTFFQELSKPTSINPVQHLDADMVRFFQSLKKKKLLEDTVVMVFSDRGMYGYLMQETVLAKMEERLPMMAVSIPQHFQTRHPQAYVNLIQNAHRLTTPFDIHETLLDILDPSRLSYRPPEENNTEVMSLFEDILVDRKCQECRIPLHWCTCMTHIVMKPQVPIVQTVTSKMLQNIASRTDGVRDRCWELDLRSINTFYLVMPTWRVLTLTHPHGKWRKWQEFDNDFDLRVAYFLVTLKVGPCDVLYQATMVADFRNHTHYRYEVLREEVKSFGVRRYHYGCVSDRDPPSLKTFCCCRSNKKKP
ncbi:hypothetical protein ACOMHN_047719 [Nucella lapillus]